MSFGFSVGDFIAVGRLVLNLYNACKDAPGEFREINGKLSSLHIILCDLAEQALDPTSLLIRRGKNRGPEWREIRLNLEATLCELQDLVDRYRTMGRSAWRRVRLASENLSELRAKLGFHLGVINVFLDSLALSALGRMEPVLGRIETLLRDYVREEQAGQKAATVLAAHETDDAVSWKQVEMDLLTEGISQEDFEKHRDRIKELLNWVVWNEASLAHLKDVTPDDSVSCFSKATPSSQATIKGSIVRRIQSSSFVTEPGVYPVVSDDHTEIPSVFGGKQIDPVETLFGPPPDFDAEFANIHSREFARNLHQDVWKSLDLDDVDQKELVCQDSPAHAHWFEDQLKAIFDISPSFDDSAMDNASTVAGPQMFWHGSEWSVGDSRPEYMVFKDEGGEGSEMEQTSDNNSNSESEYEKNDGAEDEGVTECSYGPDSNAGTSGGEGEEYDGDNEMLSAEDDDDINGNDGRLQHWRRHQRTYTDGINTTMLENHYLSSRGWIPLDG
ncbi:hypothetical protein BKA61DRAFT_665023 [Leptodontidium sp. MPI-SDFR-AT-0119]|nr:hypothetical protein BKA61DRAFT_665023 [Leptodontidium sp. MPI-SDFR-AT-0119]